MRVVILMLGFFAIGAQAQTIEELEQRVAELEALVAELSSNLATDISTENPTGAPNVITNPQLNSIDPEAFSSTISGGGYGGNASNHIGLPSPDYETGSARHAIIAGGYDNTNNQLAGTISGGAHHYLVGNGDHGTISGGSNHTLEGGSYSTIGGGTRNYGYGYGVTIAGGLRNTATENYAVIAGGTDQMIEAPGGVILGGRYNEITASGSYSAILGGRDSVASGSYSASFGRGVVNHVPGSLAFSGRYNDNPGDAQALQFHLSNTTYGSSPKYLATTGSWTAPTIPDNTAWAGEAYVIARRADNGAVSSYTIPIVVGRTNGAGWVASGSYQDKTELVNQIGLGDLAVSVSVDSGSLGAFRLNVLGLTQVTLHWGAYVAVTQVQ